MKLPRNAQIWFPDYIKSRVRAACGPSATRVWLAITDHYEPFWRNTDEGVAADRVALWAREWPKITSRFADTAGRPPVYSFFYPEEEYRPRLLDQLADMTEAGIGDVEVHLHHDCEGEANFLDRMSQFIETLMTRHGLLRRVNGRPAFGFIHGNWALDNSNPDGRKCGLNNELTLLARLGCYADFTMPSAPHAGQSSLVNTIYWALDDEERPKSYDTGKPVTPGDLEPEDALMMIPGPLGIRSRLFGNDSRLMPRIERGELAGFDMPSRERVRLWLDVAPRIGTDIFIKLFTHGTQERNAEPLLGTGFEQLFSSVLKETEARGMSLYFASAWQMRQAIEALRRGEDPVARALHAEAVRGMEAR
jgi:hypothetical protein